MTELTREQIEYAIQLIAEDHARQQTFIDSVDLILGKRDHRTKIYHERKQMRNAAEACLKYLTKQLEQV